jgi:hypothetical protein
MHNDLALTLVRTLADYMGDLEIWLEELMVRNVIDSLIIATTNFNIKFLLTKAGINNSKESSFKDSRIAIVQMKENIGVIREYFESLIKVFPALGRTKRRLFTRVTNGTAEGAMGYTTLRGITSRNGATGFNVRRGRGRPMIRMKQRYWY